MKAVFLRSNWWSHFTIAAKERIILTIFNLAIYAMSPENPAIAYVDSLADSVLYSFAL